MKPGFPKIIWISWQQGEKNMPWVVGKCYESWKKHNPEWKIIFLDDTNISQYVEIEDSLKKNFPLFSRQVISNFIRLAVLKKHGGVWADATCYCMKPLDTWLPDVMDSGVFMFSAPGHDRMISNWFIASEKEHELIRIFYEQYAAYWIENPKVRLYEKSYISRIYPLISYNTSWWFQSLFTKVFKIRPYFLFHYLFTKLYKSNGRLKELWDQTPKFAAEYPLKLGWSGLLDPLSPDIKKFIDDGVSPMHKLNWSFDMNLYRKNCVMAYLLGEYQPD